MRFFLAIAFSTAFSAIFPLQGLALPTKGSYFLISAACPEATRAAQEIAESGGNAVDVALTALVVMSVTRPSFAALGGGGFAMVKMKGQTDILDFREVAPLKAGPDFYKDKAKNASTVGGSAVAVPGLPAGIEALHKKYGKIHWSRLFDRAIVLAEKGFRVSGDWVNDTNGSFGNMTPTARKFVTNGNPNQKLKPGYSLKQPQLGKLLRQLRNRKSVAFYTGDAANDLVNSVQKAGGVISLKDLAQYKPVWRKPLTIKKFGYQFHLMPPPSSGGVVIASALKLLEHIPVREQKLLSADEAHAMVETLKLAYKGRSELADPEFHKNPIDHLLSDDHLKTLAADFSLQKAIVPDPLKAKQPDEATQTSHLSVLFASGDAVSMTFTLNGNYGSGVATEKYGVFLNNEMDDFTTRPDEPNMFGLIQGSGNKVEPGKRPLSSMSPTIVEKNGKTFMAVGAPGGPRIISSTFQTIYRVIFSEMDIDEAIQTRRVHHQYLPNKVIYDKNKYAPGTLQNLRSRGHEVEAGWQGLVYGIILKDGVLEGSFDSRGEGAVSGY